MSISWLPIERCPQCGYILDYFETFSAFGAQCGSCGWKKEDDGHLIINKSQEISDVSETDKDKFLFDENE